jgi:hypothetical protein
MSKPEEKIDRTMQFKINEKLFNDLMAAIHKHDGNIALVEVIGILEIIKDDLITQNKEQI